MRQKYVNEELIKPCYRTSKKNIGFLTRTYTKRVIFCHFIKQIEKSFLSNNMDGCS